MQINGNHIGNEQMTDNRKLIKKILKKNTLEIKELIDSFPKDKFFTISLKEIKLGCIRESYNVSVSYDNSEYAYIKTDYIFYASVSSANKDKDKYFDMCRHANFDSAFKMILNQIPEECFKYIKVKTIKDTEN